MTELPIFGPAPETPLCQHPGGGCGACCGLYNFVDRSQKAEHDRLLRRSRAVRAAMPGGRPNREALAAVRDQLLAEETPQHVTRAIKVCPYAGYLDDELPTAPGEGRVGCMIHPARTPDGEDVRDLAVYEQAICAGHFCASHEWLRPDEVSVAQQVGGTLYGRVVTDAGLVKALKSLVEESIGRRMLPYDAHHASEALREAFEVLLERWPWASKDPRRFGGVVVDDDDVTERTVTAERFGRPLPRPVRTLLDAAATEVEDEAQLDDAIARCKALVAAVVSAVENGHR